MFEVLSCDQIATPVKIQSNYSSALTANSPMYYRDCQKPKVYYDTLQINVVENGLYVIWSESKVNTYGYIYEDNFNPLKPTDNLLFEHDGTCNQRQLKFFVNLTLNIRYVLVVTTSRPYTTGRFSLLLSGPNDVTIGSFGEYEHSLVCCEKEINLEITESHEMLYDVLVPKDSYCIIGDQCNFHSKSIGLTLDDILRDQLRLNTTFSQQSRSVKTSAALTIVMLVGGLINSILSFLTFHNKEVCQVGCGIYLLASSITSLLTISMFTIKVWFGVLTQINLSTSLSLLRGGCLSIEPVLKLFLYWDGWLNACVAVERAIHVFKGVDFDKKKSRRLARWIIIILPFCITASLIHEPMHRDLFVYQSATNRSMQNETYANMTHDEMGGRYVSCVIRYPPAVQDYNTVILFFHLIGPFLANLFSALFVIFGAARQRSAARTDHSFKEHVREQFSEHKQLLISPLVLLVLSTPRLIISLLSGCVKTSENLWLYVGAYFISFTPSILVFVIFVVPSDFYMKTF